MHLLTKGRIVRIICDSNTDCSRTLYYNDEGLLACSEGTARTGDGTLVTSEYFVFTWEDGNVVKTIRQTIKDGNITEETEYNYEYSTAANPLHGFIFLIHSNSGIIFDYEGIDALSKNLPSRITSQKHRYEFSFSGEQVSSGEKHLIADSSPILRMTTDYSLDFEYLK
ncbi:MAG: hypothetical protein IJM35_09015 [Bacteroidales bacterium]|nr:hypothetical protein [Bacteroidales bacterium]